MTTVQAALWVVVLLVAMALPAVAMDLRRIARSL